MQVLYRRTESSHACCPRANSGREVQYRADYPAKPGRFGSLRETALTRNTAGPGILRSMACHSAWQQLCVGLWTAPIAPDVTSVSFAGSESLNKKAAFQAAFSHSTSSGSFPTNIVTVQLSQLRGDCLRLAVVPGVTQTLLRISMLLPDVSLELFFLHRGAKHLVVMYEALHVVG
jgi:hypothetical protein